MFATSQHSPEYSLWTSENSAVLFTNRNFGNVVPALSDDGQSNRDRALDLFHEHSGAFQLATLKPFNGNLVDLDTAPSREIYQADALVTTNPNHILHMRPADCGAIAIKGFGQRAEREVTTLIHTSRHILNAGSHLRVLDYIKDHHGVSPEDMQVFVAPSARAFSYSFPTIEDYQKMSALWRNYVDQDLNGQWHIDLHNFAVDDLHNFGINPRNITQPDIDTAANQNYFSNRSYNLGIQPTKGGNGVFFALG